MRKGDDGISGSRMLRESEVEVPVGKD